MAGVSGYQKPGEGLPHSTAAGARPANAEAKAPAADGGRYKSKKGWHRQVPLSCGIGATVKAGAGLPHSKGAGMKASATQGDPRCKTGPWAPDPRTPKAPAADDGRYKEKDSS